MSDNAHASEDSLDVVVVGGGQAGLAAGWHLADRGLRFLIVDSAPEIGHSWRMRWDSLRLFSPARYDALPGLPFPASPDTYPTKDQVADYLADYAAAFELPVLLDTRVTALRRGDGRFLLETSQGTLRARQVLVATGPFQEPAVPRLAGDLAPEVVQLHSARYRRPADLPVGHVVVVGAGNSGVQIAEELVTDRTVSVAVGSRPPELPQRFLGRDLFWWMTRSGLLRVSTGTWVGRRFRARGELLIGSSHQRLERTGVRLRPRLVAAEGRILRFADGSAVAAEAVVWATGFRPDYSWIQVPGVVDGSGVVHRRGVTDVPGLYFLGLPWQHTRGSALLGFVQHDAAWLTDRVTRLHAAAESATPAGAS